jgi:hypothetical protein
MQAIENQISLHFKSAGFAIVWRTELPQKVKHTFKLMINSKLSFDDTFTNLHTIDAIKCATGDVIDSILKQVSVMIPYESEGDCFKLTEVVFHLDIKPSQEGYIVSLTVCDYKIKK